MSDFVSEPESLLSSSPTPESLTQLRAAAMAGDPGDALPKVEAALRNYPDDPGVQKYAGVLHYRRKEFGLAEPLLTRAVSAAATDFEAAIFLMRVYYNIGNDQKCELTARALLGLQPHNADALRTLGRIYNRRNDWAQAAEAWRHLAEANPGEAEAPLQAARSYRRQDFAAEALEFANRTLSVEPANAEALRIKVEAAIALDRYETLPSVIVAYFDLHPDRALALIERLAQGKDVPAAAAMLAALAAAHPMDEAVSQTIETAAEDWRVLAIRSELQRNDKEAAICLGALRTLRPEDQTLTESLDRIKRYFLTTMKDAALVGDNDATFDAAEMVLMVDPGADEAWFAIGRSRLVHNDPGGAVAPLRSAAESDPENAWYLLNYARALQQSGNLIPAIPVYRQVIELSNGRDTPHSAEARRVLGRLPSMLLARAREALSEGRPMEALAVHEFLTVEAPTNPDFEALLAASLDTFLAAVKQAYKAHSPATRLLAERFLGSDPDNAGVELILARTLMREKAYEEALPLWEKLSRITPEDAHYQLQIARCHARVGDSEEAVVAARRVLALDPAIDEARSIIAQFQSSNAGDA